MTDRSKRRQVVTLKKMQTNQVTNRLSKTITREEKQGQKISLKSIKRQVGKAKNFFLSRQKPIPSSNECNDSINQQISPTSSSHRKTNKFKRLINQPIGKHDQNIQSLVQQLIPKAKAFYRFGMKSYQKHSHKRVFSDVLNLPSENMKGLFFVGELWDSHMTNKYMKLNKVNMNKIKLFQKFKDLNWQRVCKQRQRQMDSTNLINSVRQFSQKSKRSINTIPHIESLLSLKHTWEDDILQPQHELQLTHKKSNQQSHKSFKQAISSIRKEITHQHNKNKEEDCWKNMKNLQKESKQIHKLWDRYFGKMLQIN